MINTPTGTAARSDGYEIRRAAVARGMPVHHHDRGRDGGRAGDRRRRGVQRAAGGLAAGAAPQRGSGETTSAGGRSQRAPPATEPAGERVTSRRWRRLRGDRRVPPRRRLRHPRRATTRTGRRPTPASSTCSPRPSAGAGAPTSARSCRARSSVDAPRARTGRLEFMLEDVGPGTHRLGELRPGDGAVARRPVRRRLRPRRATGAGRCWSAAASAPRRWPSGRTRSAPTRSSCSASATPRTPRARRCCTTRAWPPTTARAGHQGPVTDLLLAELGRPTRCRGLCLRAAADAGGGARDLRRARTSRPSSRSSPAWPAGTAPASAASCRPRGGYVRLCVDGPVLDASTPRDGSCTHDVPGPRRHPVINASGTFDAIAARRAFGDALLERFPFAAFVTKTVTRRAAPGQPAAAPVRAARRPAELDRAAQQGPGRVPGSRTCRSSPSCPSR